MSIILLENNNMQMVVDRQHSILAERGLDGFEPIKVDFLKRQVSPGDFFIDVGACEGFYTVLVSSLVGPNGMVYAFEPSMNNLDTLVVNCRLNGCKNVRISMDAMSNHTGNGMLYLSKKPGLHSLKEGLRDRNEGTQPVILTTVDAFSRDHVPDRAVNGMKIDVEGMELEVLEGAHETLSSYYFSYLAVDIHPSLGTDVHSVKALIQDCGFEITEVVGQGNEILAIKNV